MTTSYITQAFCYTDESERKIDFYLDSDDDDVVVSARVYYGLRDICTIYQDKIFVTFPLLSDQKIEPVNLDSQPPILRGFVFSIVKNSTCDIELTDGKITNVRKRSTDKQKTDKPVYLFEVEKITLIMK